MNRLGVRLVVSHLIVAFLGASVTYLMVRQLAPALFSESLRTGGGTSVPPRSGPQGTLGLHASFAAAVDTAVLWGSAVGAAAAAGAGCLAAYRLLEPLRRLRHATRQMAQGRYGERIPLPRERELADLVRDVNRLGQELASTEQTRVHLLGEVAHEMRTPLTVIDGYVEGMIDGVIPTGRAELRQVSGEVRRLRRLTEDLAALSRAEENSMDLQRTALDLRGVVLGQVERLGGQATAAGLGLTVDCADHPVPVVADAERIAQVVANLVGNAIRATEPGGRIAVSVGHEEGGRMEGGRMEGGRLEGGREGGTAWIRVTDTGEGLRPQDLAPIFERFYRVEGRRRGPTETGTGIGLTIARGIMRGHDGDLVAYSPGPGHGSTFTATLPLAAPPEPSAPRTP